MSSPELVIGLFVAIAAAVFFGIPFSRAIREQEQVAAEHNERLRAMLREERDERERDLEWARLQARIAALMEYRVEVGNRIPEEHDAVIARMIDGWREQMNAILGRGSA